MSGIEVPVPELCWVMSQDGTKVTICRSTEGQPCTVADLGTDTPTSLIELQKRLSGARDAIIQEADTEHAVIVCTYAHRVKDLPEELGVVSRRHTPGKRVILFSSGSGGQADTTPAVG